VRMVHISVIQSQLTQLGIRLSRWFNPELKELQQLLMDDEKIVACAPGRYFNGIALLVATDLRLLLIDKRAFFMTIEDTRYDMISEINFSSRLYDMTVHIFTLNKQHNFSSIRYKQQLRDLTTYVQQRVWELRQHQIQAGNDPALSANIPRPHMPGAERLQAQSTTSADLAGLSQPQAMMHSIHIPKPHLPRRIGYAAMNESRHFTPNAYTNHMTHNYYYPQPVVKG